MKDCHGIHTYRPTEHEKKDQIIKNHRYTCKCLNPLVKLHYRDCPAISKKTCPIHDKNSREQNVIITFHPSSKTERLLHPIKSLLTNCNSKTKINFQYHTPANATSVDAVKPPNGQNPCENIKKSFNNTFVERTKSFVAEKTSKVKKLRRCFHSPCNSIVRKTRSQTSLKEKLNHVFSEDVKRKVLYEMMPEIPPNDKNDWFYSSVGGAFNYRKKLSEGRLNSDFITVTQHDNKNVIHHNIFELKNNYDDISGQTNQFAYFLCKKKKKENKEIQISQSNTSLLSKSRGSLDRKESLRAIETGSERGRPAESAVSSTSSDSVYITPFFLLPKEMVSKEDLTRRNEIVKVDQVVQADEPIPVFESESVQTGNTKSTQTPSSSLRYVADSKPQTSRIKQPEAVETYSTASEPKSKSVLLQTEDYSEQSSRFLRQPTRLPSETTMEEIYMGNNAIMMRESHYGQNKQSAVMSEGVSRHSDKSRPAEVQTSNSFQYKEVIISARWEGGMKDQTSQTDELWNVQLSVKTFESKTNKSQGTVPHNSDKEMQTFQTQTSNKPSTSIHFSSNNATHEYEDHSDRSSPKMEKTWWGKSHSDTDVGEAPKCICDKVDNEQLLPHPRALTTNVENEPGPHSVTLRTKETIERVPNKETSSKEKEFTASAADLSDLKRFIQEFFDKDNNRIQEVEKPKVKATENEDETTSYEHLRYGRPEPQPPKELVNTSTQTISTSSAPRPSVASQTLQAPIFESSTTESQTEQSVFSGRSHKGAQTDKTIFPKTNAEAQTDKTIFPKTDAEAQTDVRVLLGDVEQEEQGQQKVKLLRTAIVDPESQTKSFFICAVCGRGVREGVNVATNTVNVSVARNKIRSSEIEQTCEIQLRATKIKMSRDDETKQVSPPNRSRINSMTQPSPTYRVRNIENRNNNVKVHATAYKTRNGVPVKEEKPPVVSVFMNDQKGGLSSCQCCTASTCAMSASQSRETKGSEPNSTESDHKKHKEFTFPVLTTHFWPRGFIKDWKSAENTLNNLPSNQRILRQKSSLEKDLESSKKGTLPDDKIRDLPVFGEPAFTGLLTVGKDGGFKFWPREKSKHQAKPVEDAADATEINLENSPKNDQEDIFLESALPGVMVRGVDGDYKFWPSGTPEYHSRMLMELNEALPLSESLSNQQSFLEGSDECVYDRVDSQTVENDEGLEEERLIPLSTPHTRRFHTQSSSTIHKLDVAPSILTTHSLNMF